MRVKLSRLSWKLIEPFSTAQETIESVDALLVELRDVVGHRGRGEAVGVNSAGETPETMISQLEAMRSDIERGDAETCRQLVEQLPAGGARNAFDAALWDFEAKTRNTPAWRLAGLDFPHKLATAYTIGLGDLATVSHQASAYTRWPLLKVKVDAERHLSQVRAVRESAPTARLLVDANGSWDLDLLEELAPELAALGVMALEQPLPPQEDHVLGGRRFSLPLCADESVTDHRSLDTLKERYQILNIKLDKTGGLTEALQTARMARRMGFLLMIGNMCGSSLAMAPAVLVGQLCELADLDGPLLQADDWEPALRYEDGYVHYPSTELWG